MPTNNIFTGLHKESWEAGLQWVRSIKQTGINIIVIDMGLDKSHVEKLDELDVHVAPNTNKSGHAQVDIFNSFLAYVKHRPPHEVYLFWDIVVQCEDVFYSAQEKMVAPALPHANIGTLVFPLATFDARAKIATRLEKELFERYGSVLFSGLMSASLGEWRLFVGLYNNLVETGVVDNSARNLVLNLFALYFPGHVELEPVKYQITALQLDN